MDGTAPSSWLSPSWPMVVAIISLSSLLLNLYVLFLKKDLVVTELSKLNTTLRGSQDGDTLLRRRDLEAWKKNAEEANEALQSLGAVIAEAFRDVVAAPMTELRALRAESREAGETVSALSTEMQSLVVNSREIQIRVEGCRKLLTKILAELKGPEKGRHKAQPRHPRWTSFLGSAYPEDLG